MAGRRPNAGEINRVVRQVMFSSGRTKPVAKNWHSRSISVVGRRQIIENLRKQRFDVSRLKETYPGRRRPKSRKQ